MYSELPGAASDPVETQGQGDHQFRPLACLWYLLFMLPPPRSFRPTNVI